MSFAAGVSPAFRELDLPRALELARSQSPLLLAARLRVDEARGDLTAASVLLLANPELELAAGPRLPGQAGDPATPEIDVGISQRFEIGGQRGHRVARATHEVAASMSEVDEAERVVALAVASGFFDVLAASERRGLAVESEALAKELWEVVRVRVEKGAEPPVVLGSAKIRLAEARRKTGEAGADLAAATVRLARALGIPPATQLVLSGKLPEAGSIPPVDDLVARAQASRPDIVAAAKRLEASRASSSLADSVAWPDLTLGVRYGVDQQDRLVTGTLGIALPLFSRNQGERERSRATVQRIEAELSSLRLGVEAESREARARFDAAADAIAIYDADVLQAQRESLAQLRAAYSAGKIDFAQVLLLQRELLEGRAGYLDARLALAKAEVTLRAVAGLEIAPARASQGETR